jgi:type IV secretion system protein VirB9
MYIRRLVLLLAVPAAAHAQTVPPLDVSAAPTALTVQQPDTSNSQQATPPPPINLLSGKETALSALERRSVLLSKEWINATENPARGDNGRVVFTFGASLPSVVCSPLHVCDIELQAGEVVNDIRAGDPVRWKVTPASSGTGASRTTHLTVKPTDSALRTNLDVATDRRMYIIQLVSRTNEWMPSVGFAYPEDAQASWQAYHEAQELQQQATVLPTGENLATLDFDYRIDGKAVEWKPLRVYTTGQKTYVQFSAAVAHGDLPALVALGTGNVEALVNYRKVGDRFEVDKLLRRFALIRGVGRHQQRIDITYIGKL